ncbi:type II secretion system protein GspK [Luteimonas granuli]|uniref:General secretion pathway protein GspK n=1 Tax=Luteimonas granuli TaxID=1176533 RepID=A0A518N374_9GAMM|nr:type II secretion system protein GspK [Luteimonas granuli]QDW66349.1 general secretion pathway protein GspK [Luteimonas granuli]
MLVLVLALLVVLTLLATAVAVAGRQAVAEAQLEVDRLDGELDMVSTRDTLLYMLSVQFRTLGGLTVDDSKIPAIERMRNDADDEGESVVPVGNEIRLDSTPYAGLGNARFSIQDDRGLLSPNWAGQLLMQRFYTSMGSPAQDWGPLEAKRLDYQDADDLHRLGGAEKDDYRKAGLPPPSNRAFASPLELRRVLGWNGLLAPLTDEQLLRRLTTARSVEINVNSAPHEVLALLPGLDDDHAARLVDLRRQAPFMSTWQVEQLVPIDPAVSDGLLTLFPNLSGSLTLWDARLGTRRLVHWTLTPYLEGSPPWRIDYEVTLPRGNPSDQPVAAAPATPLLTPPDASGDPGWPAAAGR